MELRNRKDEKKVKTGDIIQNNSELSFEFVKFTPTGMIIAKRFGKEDEYHPASFDNFYRVMA